MGIGIVVNEAMGIAMMSRREVRWCVREAAKHERIVEVGSWRGGTTKAMASLTPGTVTSVDTCEGVWFAHGQDLIDLNIDKGLDSPEEIEDLDKLFRSYLAEEIASGKVKVIRKPSVEAAKGFKNASLDMVFIDADHEYESVIADIKAWLPKVEPGGLICGHDCAPRNQGVVKAVRKLLPDSAVPVDSIWSHVC